MNRNIYQYKFGSHIAMADVDDALRVAVVASESVFGRERVSRETDFELDEPARSCWIDATSEVGRHLHQIFRGFVGREFAPRTFNVTKITLPHGHGSALAV